MMEYVVIILTAVVAVCIAYDQGHFNGRKMVRDEWMRSMRDGNSR